jgi:O-antigen/teichoic acid export membrane protein
MVSWLLGASRLGIYGTAVAMAESMGRISSIVGPVVYSKSSAERSHELVPRIPILLSIVASSTLALGLTFALAGRVLIPVVFGHDFSDAFVPTLTLIPGIVFMGMTSVLNNFMGGKGYPPVLFAANLAALIVNVSLNSVLIARFGITGAAVSSTVSYISWFLALRVVYRRYLGDGRTGPETR